MEGLYWLSCTDNTISPIVTYEASSSLLFVNISFYIQVQERYVWNDYVLDNDIRKDKEGQMTRVHDVTSLRIRLLFGKIRSLV